MTYPKIIERPYKVYIGTQNYVSEFCSANTVPAGIEWRYDKSFELETDEFVKIERKDAA